MSFAAQLAHLWRSRGFRRLAVVRIFSQGGDGAFQVGIVAAFFFDPNAGATALEIATGMAIMFAPFTLVGPIVGPLIDRWHRQRIVLWGNGVRLTLAAAIITAVAADAPRWLLYALALTTLSVNRFLLAAFSAGLPRLVAREELLTANAIMPTLGTIAASLGGVAGGVLAIVAPRASDDASALFSIGLGAALFGLSSLAVTRIGRGELGPDALIDSRTAFAQARGLLRDLVVGLAHLRSRVTPLAALGVMAYSRLVYGVMFVSAVLMSRTLWASPDDTADALASLTMVVAFAAVGFAAAVVLTPWLASVISRRSWIVACLLVGAVGQAVLASGDGKAPLLAGAAVTSFAVQGVKIAVDTIVQRDTDDAYRGRAFALYDVFYNAAFIGSAFLAALLLPDTGHSVAAMVGLAGAYVIAAAAFSRSPDEARAA